MELNKITIGRDKKVAVDISETMRTTYTIRYTTRMHFLGHTLSRMSGPRIISATRKKVLGLADVFYAIMYIKYSYMIG